MARVAARSLNCPHCGGTISVRNGFKAKTATCPSCDSILDLRKPPFEVLGQLESKRPPSGHLCVGMRGRLDDQAIEIIGRIVLLEREYDPEDGWETTLWDEWLVLSEDGSYLWIGEESGRYSIQRIVHPESPPTREELGGSVVTIDGERLRVRERGVATIEHMEGELTWRAPLHQPIHYIDAGFGANSLGIEFSEEEIEFFRMERISDEELFRIFELDEHIALLDAEDARQQEKRRAVRRRVMAMGIAVLGALFATTASCVMAAANPVLQKGTVPLPVEPAVATEAVSPEETVFPAGERFSAAVAEPIQLGALTLDKSAAGYALTIDALMTPPVDGLKVELRSPSGQLVPLMDFRLTERGWAKSSKTMRFSVPETGEWSLMGEPRLTGGAQLPVSGKTIVPPPGAATASFTLIEQRTNAGVLMLVALALFALSGLLFLMTLVKGVARGRSTLQVDLLLQSRALHDRLAHGETP